MTNLIFICPYSLYASQPVGHVQSVELYSPLDGMYSIENKNNRVCKVKVNLPLYLMN
jgi:hypothetical protein